MFGFNPYSPYGMLPETMPQQGVLGQYPQNMRQPAQGQQAGPGWVTVPTVKDIANVSVQPGVKAWIMAQNDAVFAVRSADQMGVTTTEYYRFERYDPDVEARVNRTEEFVTRKEFDKLVDSLGGIFGRMNPLMQQLSGETLQESPETLVKNLMGILRGNDPQKVIQMMAKGILNLPNLCESVKGKRLSR